MSFAFKFSFSFSLVLGSPQKNRGNDRNQHAITEVEEDMQPTSILNQQQLEPARVINEAELSSTFKPACSNPAGNVVKSNSSPTDEISDSHIPGTPRSKAMDSESLQILLRSRKNLGSPTVPTPPSDIGTPGQRSNSSPVQVSPITVSTKLLDDPFTFSPTLPVGSDHDDSGSDLVSSLQRLRIGGLAAYFQELDERASRAVSPPPSIRVSGQHDATLENGQAEAQHDADHTDCAEWEEVVEGEVGDGDDE